MYKTRETKMPLLKFKFKEKKTTERYATPLCCCWRIKKVWIQGSGTIMMGSKL